MEKISKFKKLFYGAGNLGYGVVSQTYTNLIMSFGTIALGMPGTLMGLAVAISVLWDAFTDPIVGYLSDTKKSGIFGKRHGFLLLGCFGMAITNILLWTVPNSLSVGWKFAWLLIFMLLLETFNTFFATPYTALGAEVSADYDERTSIQSYKTTFFLLGLVVPSILMFFFFPNNNEQYLYLAGYSNTAYVTSALCLICGLICFFGTKNFIKKIDKAKHYDVNDTAKRPLKKIFSEFFATLKNKEYKKIVFGYATASISTAFLTAVGIHVFSYTFHFSTSQISILLGVLVLAAIISQMFWLWVSEKTDKKPALISGICVSFVGIVAMLLLFLLRANIDIKALYLLCAGAIFISGFGSGVLYSLPISMFSDVVSIEFAKTKKEQTATYSGFMTFAFKSANAIASLVIGVVLDLIKFDSKSGTTQPISVQNGLGWTLILGVLISLIVGAIIFSKYKLNKKQVQVLIEQTEIEKQKYNNEEE